jgi:hypothetical protein
MRRIELPDGGWADFISEPDEVTERRLRLHRAYLGANQATVKKIVAAGNSADQMTPESVVEAISEAQLSPAEMLRMEEINDAVIVCTLTAWSRDEPLPTVEQVIDLPSSLIEVLRTEAARSAPLLMGAKPDFSPTTDVDVQRPTGRRAPSGGRSKAKVG